MILNFSTPCAWQDDILCASFGFAGSQDPTIAKKCFFPIPINGVLLTGTLEECLSSVPEGNYQAGLVFLGNCGGEDEFIRKMQEKAGCCLVGGSAAIDPITGKSGLVMGEGQAAVFLVNDDDLDVWVESKNIHDEIIKECSVEMESPRVFASIDGQDPLSWYDRQRKERGILDTDFEHLTLSDTLGVNAHMSVVDGKLVSGRDLESTMLLRYVHPDRVYSAMQSFYKDDSAIVCGCAGLKGILPEPLEACPTGLFLFGEVCTINGISKFGNLMLSKLCVRKK